MAKKIIKIESYGMSENEIKSLLSTSAAESSDEEENNSKKWDGSKTRNISIWEENRRYLDVVGRWHGGYSKYFNHLMAEDVQRNKDLYDNLLNIAHNNKKDNSTKAE